MTAPSTHTPVNDTAESGRLFALPTPATAITGVRSAHHDPVASDAALTGDTYDWLAALLPAPEPPHCEGCQAAMVLPATAPVLWTCPACHPKEAM